MKIRESFSEFKKLDKELKYLKDHALWIGVLNEETSKDPPINPDSEEKVYEYAIRVEYGTQFIPARPFFRTVFMKKIKNIEDRMKSNIEKVVTGDMTGEQALNNVGLLVKGYIINSIKNGNWAPNSEATIAIKGKNNPLIDTGTLIKSIDYEIRRK